MKRWRSKHTQPQELVFSPDDPAAGQPAAIPDEVRQILASDEYVRSLLEEKKLTAQKLPAAWFSASRVHLGGKYEDDLLVMGAGPVMGANATTFWIFCPTPHGYTQALKVSTHTLVVKDARWKGAKELEAQSATSAEVFRVSYRYDGLEYKSYKEASEPLR